MGYRRVPFAPNEWHHIYSRGIDKRDIFIEERDFLRFQALLYLTNSIKPVNFDSLKNLSRKELFQHDRKNVLVAVGGYCLMKNHPHIIVQEKKEGGITTFMRKLGTAYNMYFNKKYDRIGNLMVKPFRSKHIADDRYLYRVIQYVHLNPVDIFEPNWKENGVEKIQQLEVELCKYPYSSLPDYLSATQDRPERFILDREVFDFIKTELPPINTTLQDFLKYQQEIELEFELKKSFGQENKNK